MDKKKKNRDRRMVSLLIGLTLVGGVAGYIFMDTFYGEGKLRGYFSQISQVDTSVSEENAIVSQGKMDIDESSYSSFAIFGKNFLLSTKDGVKYFAEMGDHTWNDTFNMNTPQLVSEGDYAAVGDMSGKTIRVYNVEGLLYSVQAEGELMQFALNANGYLSVISKKSDAYHIQIYNATGTLLKGRVEESAGAFPLCSDVSDDNKSFAVSYMDTSDIEPLGKVLFFYINLEDSENYTDSMFAGVEKTEEVIPVIGFMEGGYLAAISDKFVYGISSQGHEAWSYTLQNKLQQVSLTNKEDIILTLGDRLLDQEGYPVGTVLWINHSGKESAQYEAGKEIDYLKSSKYGVVIGTGKDYFGLKPNGKLDWSYRATSEIRDILPMESLEQVMVVSEKEATITEMSGVQTEISNSTEEVQTEPEVVGGTGGLDQTQVVSETESEVENENTEQNQAETTVIEEP